jgi:hypothetical protein
MGIATAALMTYAACIDQTTWKDDCYNCLMVVLDTPTQVPYVAKGNLDNARWACSRKAKRLLNLDYGDCVEVVKAVCNDLFKVEGMIARSSKLSANKRQAEKNQAICLLHQMNRCKE